MIAMLGFANFAGAQVIDYDEPKQKNWWLMPAIGNISHNVHHELYTARWGADIHAETEVQNLYLGVTYGQVFRYGDTKELNIEIGRTFLGRVTYDAIT